MTDLIDYYRRGGPCRDYRDTCRDRSSGCPCTETAEALEAQQAVIDAARPMMGEIQKQLEQMDGGTQFEFFSPEIDMYQIYKIRTALAKLEKSND